ncbi:hypothetical protein PPERSA_03010 [Pseudocohnilembus persalinus]|uniref:Peptidase M14 domain-containing protein n=1 Tax=Pseudocohnilembus persalinus TaxID=266149 RepID=A0A0V0QEW2_PSEPJ|nr:hypothetical protein PPERSA_03010 [Pseudocohnilembus persalinus]|eukprot:KRX00750.1 hypothetical protein PPERSA_03010 [Pseudocohnilembus persalinus]
MSFISQEEENMVKNLKSIGQSHLVENLDNYTKEQRVQFLNQYNTLEQTLPGGCKAYVERSRKLLQDSKNNVNPYEGYKPIIPTGENIDYENTTQVKQLESLGKAEIDRLCFVLVAGGLGERLGYKGIKIQIPIELLTKQSYLEYYIKYILALQKRGSQGCKIPLAIMTSDDTYALTMDLLNKNDNFGLQSDQLFIMKQEKVPSLIDNDAKFAQAKDSLLIETKPHGHGDVHQLIHQNKLHQRWLQQGKNWVLFFQDTNPLCFRSLLSFVGVSVKQDLVVNSMTIPRKPGEALGAICKLSHENGQSLTINVEYNQLESLFEGQKEPVDIKGYSRYPGNTNTLLFRLPEYSTTLTKTDGVIPEFINPKYADETKTVFKSPTRLECMMQEFPKLLTNGENVGYTQVNRDFCFAACKNDIVSAVQKQKSGLAPECTGSTEQGFYNLNYNLLRLAGAQIEKDLEIQNFAGINYQFNPKIVLDPEFGVTLEEIQNKLTGQVKISKNSSLIIKGDYKLGDLELDGHLEVKQNLDGQKTVEITNFNKENYKQNPQALIIGGFHGDEAIGPNVVTYLAEYILNNYESSLYFKDLVENKMVVLLPMANPSGYFQLKREEIQMNGQKIDINRDFPYNNVASKCFKSAGARVINYLFKKYLFQVGITFHGGMYAIGYPWGSVNHQKKPNVGDLSPDNKAFSIIGNYMKQMSPGNKKLQISEYPVDTLTNGIYAVPGTLEDWAYAAQWEPEKTGNQYLLAKCDNISQQELQLPENSVKSLFYLIETSGPKKPQASTLGTYEAVSNKNSENFGHIPRNINAALAIIETLKPTIYMNIKDVDGNKYMVSWQVYGCSKVDKTQLYYQIEQKNEQYNYEQKYKQENFISSENVFSGDGYIKNQTHYFKDYIQKSNLVQKNQELKVAIYVQCDSQFGEQQDSVPDLPPQSHLVQSRTNCSYHIKNNNDYEILQTKEIFQTNFQNQYAKSIKYKNFQKLKFQKADNKINEIQNNEQNKNVQINQVETEFLQQNNEKNDNISRNLQLGQDNQNDGENQKDGQQQQNNQIQDGEIKQQDGENNPQAYNQQDQSDGENNQQLKDNQSQQNDGEDTNKNQNNNENQQDQDGETEEEEEKKNDNLSKNNDNENDQDQDNNEQDQDQDEQKQEEDTKNDSNNNNSSKNNGDKNKKNNKNLNGDKNGGKKINKRSQQNLFV